MEPKSRTRLGWKDVSVGGGMGDSTGLRGVLRSRCTVGMFRGVHVSVRGLPGLLASALSTAVTWELHKDSRRSACSGIQTQGSEHLDVSKHPLHTSVWVTC